jgi:hypothetical protein
LKLRRWPLGAASFLPATEPKSMRKLINGLLLGQVVLILHPLGDAQVREFGTGTPEPVKAPHLGLAKTHWSRDIRKLRIERGMLSCVGLRWANSAPIT